MEDLGRALPGSEGFIDAEQEGERKQPNEFCLNCGTKLLDTFCHHCGQKDIAKRQTLGELLTNFISSFWSYEGKFFKTLKFLIIKPGFLASEYNAGKRESYYHPARMYVFISFVFFLLLTVVPSEDLKRSIVQADFSEDEEKSIMMPDSIKSVVDSVKIAGKKKSGDFNIGGDYSTLKAYDSAQSLLPLDKRDGWFVKNLSRRAIEINQKYKGKSKEFVNDFRDAFFDNFSKVLFWLLPFFALLLKLLYVRRDHFYSEHLVFSIYYYNFFYFAGSLQIIIRAIPSLSWAANLVGFWIIFYLLFAMKRVYQQSWRKTILKYFLFLFSFLILMSVGFVISAFFIFMGL